jgi:hypothetical protein
MMQMYACKRHKLCGDIWFTQKNRLSIRVIHSPGTETLARLSWGFLLGIIKEKECVSRTRL